jgi:fucose permease
MTFIQDGTAVTVAGAFVFGMVLALLGSIKLPLAKRLNLSEVRVGWLLSALNLALIPMMLVSGMLIDGLGVKGVLLVGALGTGSALFALAMTTNFAGIQVAILALGIGGACLSSGSSVLMPRVFFPGNEAASLNLGNVFFGLGALVTPALADFLIAALGYRRAVGLLAVLGLSPAVLAALASGEALLVPPGRLDFGSVLSDPVVWLAGLVFLCYGPLEGSIGTWATTYLTDLGFREHRAALMLSGFWLAFLAARLGIALAQKEGYLPKATEPWLIVGLALGAAVCLGNLAGARTPTAGASGLLLLGMCFGPIFPTLVAILYESVDKRVHGTAYGAMFSIGSVGSLVLPPVIGTYARKKSVQRAMRIPLVVALLLALATVLLGLVRELVHPR